MAIQERLPRITIKTDVPPKQFLERLRDLVPKQIDWRLYCFDRHYLGKDSIRFGIAYQGLDSEVSPDTLYFFYYDPSFSEHRVQVQIVSAINDKESIQITYDSYVYKARLIKSLLLSYNRSCRARVRLNIQSRIQTEPHLFPKLKGYFDWFVNNANKSGLHPSDWESYYKFIILADRYNSRLVERDVEYLLITSGFHTEVARYMAEIYGHGRAILNGGIGQFRVELYRRELAV